MNTGILKQALVETSSHNFEEQTTINYDAINCDVKAVKKGITRVTCATVMPGFFYSDMVDINN